MRLRHTALIIVAAITTVARLATTYPAQVLYEGAFASGRLAVELHQDGDHLIGNVKVNGTLCALTGSVHDDRITAEFEFNGEKFPLEAGMDSSVLVVTSGGVTHRLVRQDVPGNPLADPLLSQPATSPVSVGTSPITDIPVVPVPDAAPFNTASVEQRFPHVLDLGSGASIRYPEGWAQRKMGALTALTPLPTPERSVPGVAYVAQTYPWPGRGLASPEAAAQLGTLIARFMPGLTREGEPEPLGASFADGMRLRFSSTAINAASKVRVLARTQDNTLALLLGVGDDGEMQADEPMLREMLGTVVPPTAPIAPPAPAVVPRTPAPAVSTEHALDRALFGVWRHTESYSDAGRGTASLATETVYAFKPDGTFTIGSRSAGGDAHTSMQTGAKTTASGRWSTADGILTTVNQAGQTGQIRYLFHNGQLVFKKPNGKYVFWSR